MFQNWSGRLWLAVIVLISTTACQPGGPRPQDGQRYFTWVDEQGRVRQSPIEEDPAEAQARIPIEQVVAEGETARVRKAEAQSTEQPVEQTADRPDEPPAKQPAIAEAAPESAQPAMLSPSATSASSGEDEYNLENYPDGNELAAAGFVRDGDPEPYFTWRDAEGRARVSYYRPDTRSAVEKGLVRQPLDLTPARVHLESDRAPELAQGQLPEAYEVLGIEPPTVSFFQDWRAFCCDSLALIQSEEWQLGREFSVTIGTDAPRHEFASGSSRYRLVMLPKDGLPDSFVLRLRSFDQNGLFVPSLAFLDESLAPVRIVTDLVADFTPESWYRHGYLQAVVPAFPARGERWLLIYSTAEEQQNQTVIETERGPKAIPHAETGYLSLESVTL